jgi:hypothetical protein
MESPGGVTTVPAGRVGVIQQEMVAQRRVGVKVKGYGLTWGKGPTHIKKVFSNVDSSARPWHLSPRLAYTLAPARLAGHIGMIRG